VFAPIYTTPSETTGVAAKPIEGCPGLVGAVGVKVQSGCSVVALDGVNVTAAALKEE
jgi:hypothetical protein